MNREGQKRLEGARNSSYPTRHTIERKPKPTYSQDWPSYNAAQRKEKLAFLDILGDLCSFIPLPEAHTVGRPAADLQEMVFCCVNKVYEGLSSRRIGSDMEIAKMLTHINHAPRASTILKYFNKPMLTPILTDLIRLSSMPLTGYEDTFAVDATGMANSLYSRWFDFRFGKLGAQRETHSWLKIHLMVGTKSGIVTAINVTDGRSADSPQFPELVLETAKNFRIVEVSADKGYTSFLNYETVRQVGGQAYIPFKTGTTARYTTGSKGRAFRTMFRWFKLNEEEFYEHYHQRSNVESCFSSIKRKFRGKLMLKNEVAQVNEALAMILAFNIVTLAREYEESHALLEFNEHAHKFESLRTNRQVLMPAG
jgi:transposase